MKKTATKSWCLTSTLATLLLCSLCLGDGLNLQLHKCSTLEFFERDQEIGESCISNWSSKIFTYRYWFSPAYWKKHVPGQCRDQPTGRVLEHLAGFAARGVSTPVVNLWEHGCTCGWLSTVDWTDWTCLQWWGQIFLEVKPKKDKYKYTSPCGIMTNISWINPIINALNWKEKKEWDDTNICSHATEEYNLKVVYSILIPYTLYI